MGNVVTNGVAGQGVTLEDKSVIREFNVMEFQNANFNVKLFTGRRFTFSKNYQPTGVIIDYNI